MRLYSNGSWSVGPLGALALVMLLLFLWPVWVVRGAYRTDVRLGHAALAAVMVLLVLGVTFGRN